MFLRGAVRATRKRLLSSAVNIYLCCFAVRALFDCRLAEVTYILRNFLLLYLNWMAECVL